LSHEAPPPKILVRYVAVPGCQDAAELALSVVDAYQRKGIGTLLVRHLVLVLRLEFNFRFFAVVLEGFRIIAKRRRTALSFIPGRVPPCQDHP
jgi:hypothetical protein